MTEIMNAHVMRFSSFPDAAPRMLEISQMRVLRLANDHVGVVSQAPPVPRPRHHRDGLFWRPSCYPAVAVLSAPNRHGSIEASESRTGGILSGARAGLLRRHIRSPAPSPRPSRLVQVEPVPSATKPFALMFGVSFDILAWIGATRSHSPGLGKVHHLRQNAKGAVGLIRNMGHGAMQLGDIGRRHRADTLLGKKWIEKQLDRTSILRLVDGLQRTATCSFRNRSPSSFILIDWRLALRWAAGSPPSPRTLPST